MVEYRSGPLRGAMTGFAGSRETRCGVVGIAGGVVIVQMAIRTIGGQASKNSIGVTIGAIHGHVGSGQGEGRVIEESTLPSAGGVASFAGGWETCGVVVGIGGGVVQGLVAGTANGGSAAEDASNMTIGAIGGDVRAGQGEHGVGKAGAHPTGSRVAILAHGGEASRDVIGIGGRVEFGLVTGDTSRGRTRENVADVTQRAIAVVVHTGQGEGRVVEGSSGPGGGDVAAIAVIDPTLGNVIGVDGDGQVAFVTGDAFHVGAREFARLGAAMTTEASGGGVGSNQREARLRVQSDLSARHPILRVVTVDAVVAEQSAVNVFVTARASAGCELFHRSAVVVAPQAFGALMGALERHASFQ